MTKAQIKILERIVMDKYNRPQLKGIFCDQEQNYCFCDSYRVIRLFEPPSSSTLTFPWVIGFDVDRLMPRYKEKDIGRQLFVDDIETIKAYAKEKKAYDFGDGLPAVNPKYLLDMLRLFPGCEIYVFAEKPELNALYFKHKLGEGYLFPCRKDKQK